MDSESRFVSHLDPQTLEKARKELNEDEKERDGAIETLRYWVSQQSWLKSPMDSAFLVRFLRVRKYSQLLARKTLENFWTQRTKCSQWFENVSPDSPAILDVVSSGFFLLLPEADDQGRRVLIERPGALNMKRTKEKYGHLDVVFQCAMCVMDLACCDERAQVNGVVFLVDTTDKEGESSQVYNPANIRKSIPIYTKAYPVRVKSVNMYNLNAVFEALLNLCKAVLITDKIASRIHIHGKSLVSVYDIIDKRLLPREYLSDDYEGPCAGSIEDVVDYMKRELCRPEVVSHIKDLNCSKYCVDLEQRKADNPPAESFRKLNIE